GGAQRKVGLCRAWTAVNVTSAVSESLCVSFPSELPSQVIPPVEFAGVRGLVVPSPSCGSAAVPSVPKHHALPIYCVIAPGTGPPVPVQILFCESAIAIVVEPCNPSAPIGP